MNATSGSARQSGLVAPRRNRFFHGKMMDVYHFELETAYGIEMRRLLNRLVTGSGVVCGLDVEEGDGCAVVITSGVAIDRRGREIVVPTRTPSIPIPPALIARVCRSDGADSEDDDGRGAAAADPAHQADARDGGYSGKPRSHEGWVTVGLCYHECETDPVAVLAGDCETTTPCAPGAVREHYRVTFEPGQVEAPELSCRFPDVLYRGELDYAALARWITRECPPPPRNPCIPLANVRLHCDSEPGECAIDDIDITIRPLVFGNDILVDILTRIVDEERSDRNAR
ncbi:hypothetical protein A4U64_26680 (plasmid) [Rhodococcus sp. WB1]|uniref:hypothetical protein n=1 Tax=Rhodococcus sp. WB1 TaxID=1033922 RepID=UPI00081A6AF8|nr:hypothetical protein [Rhodococcus sp. WB1]ANZ28480.1 hypothetical protein A4U64_26680 [Rhodococcus sp. WB1]